MNTFYFNTGVKRNDNPHVGVDSGNGVMVIPFDCEDVPSNAKFAFASNYPNQKDNDPNFIVREIHNSTLVSKYAFFTISK